MKSTTNARIGLLFFFLNSIFWLACSRNNIQFGNLPSGNYTNLISIDTVQPRLSTVVIDSFVTDNATSFLMGKYKDPYLGIVSGKPFFQMTVPAQTVTISSTSQFDSACLIIHLNKYYYGDTSREQTINANEVTQAISYTYNNHLYNTSDFPVNPVPLGSKTSRIRPSLDDSITIRISDSKGLELYNKLQQQSNDVINDDDFQNYFKGISLSVNNADTTAVYGLDGTAGKIVLRIYYHTTVPYPQSQSIDFVSKANSFSFNQILTDRTGTPLYATSRFTQEFPSEQTGHVGFTQYDAGVYLKIIFPSLTGILNTDKIVKLQKAELVIRPMGQTYAHLKLPQSLYLAATDATNTIGSTVASAVPPVDDEIYELNTYYSFDVTSYVNTLLTTAGNQDKGVFAIEGSPLQKINRAVIGDNAQPTFKTQLVLTVLTINK